VDSVSISANLPRACQERLGWFSTANLARSARLVFWRSGSSLRFFTHPDRRRAGGADDTVEQIIGLPADIVKLGLLSFARPKRVSAAYLPDTARGASAGSMLRAAQSSGLLEFCF